MESELSDLFFTAAKAFAVTEGLPVSYPNKDFDDKALAEYLKLSISPTAPDVMTMCSGASRYRWIMQVSIYVRKDKGETDAKAIADKLRTAFPVTYEFTGINHSYTVITPPTPVPPVPMGGWFSIPVQFRTQAVH